MKKFGLDVNAFISKLEAQEDKLNLGIFPLRINIKMNFFKLLEMVETNDEISLFLFNVNEPSVKFTQGNVELEGLDAKHVLILSILCTIFQTAVTETENGIPDWVEN